jgi:hypothetical protein
MTKGSDKRKRQLRVIQERRKRKHVKLLGQAYRQMLDTRIANARGHGLVDDS